MLKYPLITMSLYMTKFSATYLICLVQRSYCWVQLTPELISN